MLNEFDNDG